MNLGFSFFVGFRYWRTKKANAFASFITLFAVSGIFLGVSALIIVSSVMNGLEGQLKDRILGAVPQLTLVSESGFKDWQAASDKVVLQHSRRIKGIVPSASTQAMLQSTGNIHAAQVLGIYPDLERPISKVINSGDNNAFSQLVAGQYRVVLGRQLAQTLGVSMGDKVRLFSGNGVVYTPLGPVPSQRKFTVAGLFEMGSQVDASVAYVHFEDLQKLMRQNAQTVTHLRAYLTDPFDASAIAPSVVKQFAQLGETVTAKDWRDDFGHLFSAVKMEKNMMSLMLSLIIAVAAFNIVSALVMMVVDKTSDVAVLKTQGLTTPAVMLIFIIQGSLNALLGLLLGSVAGVFVTLNINSITSALGISILGPGQILPVAISSGQIGLIVCGTLMMTLLATLYPAFTAARVQPASALRYE
ncbi:lipoprotein-releasing ABC transporter permease subunit [Shewanella intestini]|uniref:Lipoprotein-releasing ABC transporter permease subunit n=1 Tax=Shewanella intestini TaxID=2017544 RepID=A0ABS5HZ25_9GAMM|nr:MULTISPECIES: lipoprotein-releasing ABC transporter permease subunit [Shewanella]MBR9727016.1 lipoprotein-releasing ABC transporter permease subunit [Shewanella intestini]MRG35817.1 lipoprotein-releasing ABC transporter permease subunit [Shewanella sp. XMDDZSB0408]